MIDKILATMALLGTISFFIAAKIADSRRGEPPSTLEASMGLGGLGVGLFGSLGLVLYTIWTWPN